MINKKSNLRIPDGSFDDFDNIYLSNLSKKIFRSRLKNNSVHLPTTFTVFQLAAASEVRSHVN